MPIHSHGAWERGSGHVYLSLVLYYFWPNSKIIIFIDVLLTCFGCSYTKFSQTLTLQFWAPSSPRWVISYTIILSRNRIRISKDFWSHSGFGILVVFVLEEMEHKFIVVCDSWRTWPYRRQWMFGWAFHQHTVYLYFFNHVFLQKLPPWLPTNFSAPPT